MPGTRFSAFDKAWSGALVLAGKCLGAAADGFSTCRMRSVAVFGVGRPSVLVDPARADRYTIYCAILSRSADMQTTPCGTSAVQAALGGKGDSDV